MKECKKKTEKKISVCDDKLFRVEQADFDRDLKEHLGTSKVTIHVTNPMGGRAEDVRIDNSSDSLHLHILSVCLTTKRARGMERVAHLILIWDLFRKTM